MFQTSGQAGLVAVLLWAVGTVLVVLRAGAPRDGKSFAAALANLRNSDTKGIAVILLWLKRLDVPEEAQADLAQEVMLEAFRSWPKYDPDRNARYRRKRRSRTDDHKPFRGWLNRITVHTVANYWNVSSRHEVLDPDPVSEEIPDETSPAPDARLDRVACRAELAAALLCLPASMRRAVFGSVKSLASRSGRPGSTLYKVRNRAHAELAQRLEGDPIGEHRARVGALATARRVLCARGLPHEEARALLLAAASAPRAPKLAALHRRGRAYGLPREAAGPLALAALARQAAEDAEGERAGSLRVLAVDASAAALAQLVRAFRAGTAED